MGEIPNEKDKIRSLEKIDSLLNKDYLCKIEGQYAVLDFSDYNTIQNAGKDSPQHKISLESNIRALHVDRWVFDKEEHSSDKFKNILNVFAGGESNLAILVKREKEKTALYFVLKNETNGKASKGDASNSNAELLKSAITGNFNGANVKIADGSFCPLADMKRINSISCLTNIPSEKSERFISQGLEKLLDGIKPENDDETYYVLILAEPLTREQTQNIQDGYEELASALSPHAGYQFSAGKNDNESEGTMESLANSENVFSAITKTHGFSAGLGGSIGAGSPGAIHGGGGLNIGYSFSHSRTKGESSGKAETKGKNYNLTTGTTENTTYSYQAFAIKGLLEKLQMQLKRMNNGRALGLWKCASYVLASSPRMAINVANFLKSLTQGDESYVEPSIINTWNSLDSGDHFFSNVLQYLVNFTHPVFVNGAEHITPTYDVLTTELSDIMAFPRKSVSGLVVLECAEFGREVMSFSDYQGDIPIGQPYHMHRVENHQPPIMLNKDSLTSHTFITGSTGSGKSNTIYHLLAELMKPEAKCNFLVIEPAKGEYKNVFGNREDVKVYGTNPEMTPMLRINPFKFAHGNKDASKNIHILEHLDRLVEIFNVCWPMYAAMPAVLKDAIEASYEKYGWDLPSSSTCLSDSPKYPTFADVTECIRKIIDSSEYSDENKGNYKGSLITRLKSLTNGINGMIFTDDDLSNEELFDRNVIVDLSRVGSMETKALIMGILVMKLHEHRQTSGQMNAGLRHVTVLEEAHNLLKRTSTEQSAESANLLGKSVEMLANAIAEMRTYGEGFIIADQSPGLMDMSVIRNTNTKIILRLPDESDRMLVGKASSLNDNQIVELAKLQCGVASIYQNDWIQPVLCKVQKFEAEGSDKNFVYQKADDTVIEKAKMLAEAKLNIGKIDGVELKQKIERIDIAMFVKLEPRFIASLFPNNEAVFIAARVAAMKEKKGLQGLKDHLVRSLEPSLSNFEADYSRHILSCIVEYNSRKDAALSELPERWNNFFM